MYMYMLIIILYFSIDFVDYQTKSVDIKPVSCGRKDHK